jgi:hypothetical protein
VFPGVQPFRHSEATAAMVQGGVQLPLELVADLGVIHVMLVLQAYRI